MVKLTLNSNVSAMTGFAPFELNHGYMPRIDLPVNTYTTFKGVLQFAQQALWSLMAAHDAMLEHRADQMFHANRKRRQINSKELEFQVCCTLGDITWEPMSACKDFEALGKYLELQGVSKTRDLPHRQ
jgi:hypothetical protein